MDLWTISLTILAGALGIYYMLSTYWNLQYFKKMRIPYMKPTPMLGSMGPVMFQTESLARVIQLIYNFHPEAKYVGFHDFSTPVLMLRDPDLIKSVTIKHFDNFPDHRLFADEDLDPLFTKNLFSLRGARWRDMRTLLSPAFTSSKMKMMFKLISQCAIEFADSLVKQPSKSVVLEVKDAFTRYTNDVIATSAFGISVNSMKDRENDFYMMGKDVTTFDALRTFKLYLNKSFPRLVKTLRIKLIREKTARFFTNTVKTMITSRDATGISRPDMIQLMMQARNREGKEDLDITEMTAQALIFFFGGFDTSSTCMCFTAHEIAVNPEVHEKLQAEVDAVWEECDGNITYEALNGMQYMDAVISEALRLYPPVQNIDRICTGNFELPPSLPGLEPIIVTAGTNVWLPAYGIHRDPKYFPDPDKFDPERFNEQNKAKINSFTYFPFGLGPRNCIGSRFALMETKLMLFHLLAKYHLKPCPKTMIPMKLSTKTFSMKAQNGFWLQLESRE